MSPFKNNASSEIHEKLLSKGFEILPRGQPKDLLLIGKGHYYNPITKRKYSIDPFNGGRYREPNHVAITRPIDYKGHLGKKRMANLDD